VIDVGEAVTVGLREFRTTDWVLKREIRYTNGRTDAIDHATPTGSNTRWFQVAGRVTNRGESLIPTPSLDEFRVRHPGGRSAPIYRIDEIGDWGFLREAGVDDPISEPGFDRTTTYLSPDQTATFQVLFIVESGPELYLEWEAPGQVAPVYVRVNTDT
jgi:hypothetical protein